jgi:hypothetical protein
VSLILTPGELQHTIVVDDTWAILTNIYPELIQVEDVPTTGRFKFLGYDLEIQNNRLVSSLHNKNDTNYVGFGSAQICPRFLHVMRPAAEKTKSSVLSTMLHAAHTTPGCGEQSRHKYSNPSDYIYPQHLVNHSVFLPISIPSPFAYTSNFVIPLHSHEQYVAISPDCLVTWNVATFTSYT